MFQSKSFHSPSRLWLFLSAFNEPTWIVLQCFAACVDRCTISHTQWEIQENQFNHPNLLLVITTGLA